MLRTFAIFVGLVMLLGAGIAVAAWPRAQAEENTAFASPRAFDAAYGRIRPGLPVSDLARLGFDFTGPGTEKLSSLGVVEHFMPADSQSADALDPRLEACLGADDRCTAYIFHLRLAAGMPPVQVTVVVDGGRVAWKMVTGRAQSVAARRLRALAMN